MKRRLRPVTNESRVSVIDSVGTRKDSFGFGLRIEFLAVSFENLSGANSTGLAWIPSSRGATKNGKSNQNFIKQIDSHSSY